MWRKLTLALLALPAIISGQSTGEIRGIVWTAEGKPLAGAQVFVHNAGENSHDTVTSGADGVFDVRNLKPGSYWIAAYAEGPQLISESSVKLDLAAGQNLHADVTLGRSTVHRSFFKRMVRRLDGLH